MKKLALFFAAAVVAVVIAILILSQGADRSSPEVDATGSNAAESAPLPRDEVAVLDAAAELSANVERKIVEDGSKPSVGGAATKLVLIAVAKETGAVLPRTKFELFAASLDSEEREELSETEGDAEGKAELDVPPGRAISVHAQMTVDPFSSAICELPPFTQGERRETRIELATVPDLSFWCRVVRDEDGANMPFVRADFVSRAPEQEPVQQPLTADAEGLIEVKACSWKSSSLRVDVAEFAQASAPVIAGYETSARAFELRLYRGAKLSVEVVDPAARALPGLIVHARAHDYELSQSELWSDRAEEVRSSFEAITDEAGRAVLSELPPRAELELSVTRGNETLMVSREKHRLDPGEQRAVRLVVGGKATLTGRAIDQFGTPLVGATLWLVKPDPSMGMAFRTWTSYAARTITRAEGAFDFPDIAEGEWWVGPAHKDTSVDGDAIASYGQRVLIAPGAGRVEIVLDVWRGLFLRGTVRLNSGEHVADCSVGAHAVDFDHTGYLNAKTDAQGTFKVGPLCGVDYELTAGGAFQGEFAESKPLIVPGGSDNLVLIVERAAILRGKVVDASTNEPCDASIYITQSGVNEGFGYSMGSETRDNAFEMTGITAGVWDVTARSRNARIATARVSFTPGESKEITLRVAPSVTLVFKNTSASEFFYVFPACDDISLEVAGIDPAQEQRIAVAPGRITLRICDANAKTLTHKTIEIAPGSTAEVAYP